MVIIVCYVGVTWWISVEPCAVCSLLVNDVGYQTLCSTVITSFYRSMMDETGQDAADQDADIHYTHGHWHRHIAQAKLVWLIFQYG